MFVDDLQYILQVMLLTLVAGLPLLLLAGCCLPDLREKSFRLLPWSVFPALLAALMVRPGLEVHVPWFFMGSSMGIDTSGRIFLGLTAGIWLFSAMSVRDRFRQDPHRCRFAGFLLASMSGNFGLILARDLLGFYLFFAMMSFSAYGLIVHKRSSEALKAGRVYLILVLLSELAMFTALIVIAGKAASTNLSATATADFHLLLTILLFIAFGVKIGALPFQSWMVLSYQEIPVPAAIALAGAMVNAGILGWLRFLPLGSAVLPDTAVFYILFGSAAAIYGVVFGIYQKKIGRVLASSSISQMGLVTLLAGYGLLSRNGGSSAMILLTLFAVHHSLAKASLFLGYDLLDRGTVVRTTLLLAGLLLPCLSLSGLPLTSGAMVKGGLKELVAVETSVWTTYGKIFLPLSSFGTTALMLHCTRLFYRQNKQATEDSRNSTGIGPWVASVVLAALVPWLWPPLRELGVHSLELHAALHSLWPVGLGTVLALVWFALGSPLPGRKTEKGDFDRLAGNLYNGLVIAMNRITGLLNRIYGRLTPKELKKYFAPVTAVTKGPGKWEKVLGRWSVVGLCYLLICLLFFLILLSGQIFASGP